MATLEFSPSATALVMRCLKYVNTLGRCRAISLAASTMGGSRQCVAQKYQRRQNFSAQACLAGEVPELAQRLLQRPRACRLELGALEGIEALA